MSNHRSLHLEQNRISSFANSESNSFLIARSEAERGDSCVLPEKAGGGTSKSAAGSTLIGRPTGRRGNRGRPRRDPAWSPRRRRGRPLPRRGRVGSGRGRTRGRPRPRGWGCSCKELSEDTMSVLLPSKEKPPSSTSVSGVWGPDDGALAAARSTKVLKPGVREGTTPSRRWCRWSL